MAATRLDKLQINFVMPSQLFYINQFLKNIDFCMIADYTYSLPGTVGNFDIYLQQSVFRIVCEGSSHSEDADDDGGSSAKIPKRMFQFLLLFS
jgi:hypothetical protein